MTLLSMRNLDLFYGPVSVLDDITLPDFGGGQIIGVLGPNGVGKSTLLRALGGLESYRGEVKLDGEDLTALSHARRSRHIGYLPQALPQGTSLAAYEAVISAYRAVRPDLPRSRIEEAVEDVFDLLGIRDLAFRALNKLSGGQRQMVGLAQVIVRKPHVMLLDEPTSALDLRWQLNVLRVVREIVLERHGLCLIALHDINLALHHCDQIVLFGPSGLLSCGPVREAMTSRALRDAYGVEGRVELCSNGRPFVVTDGIWDPERLTSRV